MTPPSRQLRRGRLCAAVAAALAVAPFPPAVPAWAAEPGSPVPFVGYPGDGQGGPVAAPTSPSINLNLPEAETARLAYYAHVSLGVLAPRGWHCRASYGSGGATLLVAPDLLADDPPSQAGMKLRGPAVVLRFTNAENSGRYEAAEIAGPLFPAAGPFVRSVEELADLSGLRLHPVSQQASIIIRFKSRGIAEYFEFGGIEGFGTAGPLEVDENPIHGAAIWLPDQNGSLLKLDVRLPPDLAIGALSRTILDQMESSFGNPAAR